MPSPLKLENFGPDTRGPRVVGGLPDFAPPEPAPVADPLASFDKGYAAGWEDATAAARTETERADTSMINNLEDLGFTYHEARAHVMRSLTPLLNGMLSKLLPRLIRDSLGARILEEIDSVADRSADSPIELMVPPGDAAQLREIAKRITGLPINVVAEETVPEGQVFLRIGQVEREIDLSGPIANIQKAFDALDELNREVPQYG